MDILPPVVQSVVEAHLKSLLYWFSSEPWQTGRETGQPLTPAELLALAGYLVGQDHCVIRQRRVEWAS